MKMLVGIDLSESTDRVVNEAEKFAKTVSTRVWILHVAAPEPDFVGYGVGPQSVRDSLSEKLHREHRQIQEIADRLRKAGIDATALLVQGATVETILEKAQELQVDIIVVGSHGRGAMHQLLVGSVSEGIMRQFGRPVLVVPTRDTQ